jgi:hypothetical protein
MKKKIITILALFISIVTLAQTPTDFAIAKSLGGTQTEIGNKVVVGKNGKIFTCGNFRGSFNTTVGTVNGQGDYDAFVACYDSLGALIWIKAIGGTSLDESYAIDIDSSSNVYVSGGFFSNTLTLGSLSINNPAGRDIFFAKLDENGNELLLKKYGGTENDIVNELKIYNDSIIVFCGSFGSTVNFGNSVSLTTSGQIDGFFLKTDLNGEAIFAKKIGGTSGDFIRSLTIDKDGNIYITGEYSSTANFGGQNLTSSGQYDVFTAKYDKTGNLKWARKGGGTSFDYGYGIGVDNWGNVYVSGYFTSTTFSFGSTNLSNGGNWEIYVVKYDSIGTVKWAKKFGTSQYDYSYGLVVDKAGDIIIHGGFGANISFGSFQLVNTNSSTEDLYFAKLDTDGNVRWAKSVSSNNYVWANGITTDYNSNIYAVGTFENTTTFGTKVLVSQGGDADYGDDFFLCKIEQTVVDTIPPVITFVGNDTINYEVGENYIEPGFSASDNFDGNITSKVQINSNINNQVSGIYQVIYNVSDLSGNSANKIRTIIYNEIISIRNKTNHINNIYLYPNVISKNTFLNIHEEIAIIEIINSNGSFETILKKNFNFLDLKSGIYTIKMYNSKNNLVSVEKLIVK